MHAQLQPCRSVPSSWGPSVACHTSIAQTGHTTVPDLTVHCGMICTDHNLSQPGIETHLWCRSAQQCGICRPGWTLGQAQLLH